MTPQPGVVSVVVVAATGDETERAANCVQALRQLDWPESRLEIVLVIRAEHRSQADPLRRAGVKVVVDKRPGLSAARNRGADTATGEYLAFLDASATPDPAWIGAGVKVLEHDRGIACVASKVTERTSGALLFSAPALSFLARPTVPTAEESSSHDVAQDCLFASAGAMFVRSDLFRRAGAFDERYEQFIDDVDLGWRLWLLGHRVRYVPETTVRLLATSDASTTDREAFLRVRNSLFTIFKNYDDDSLALALPAALLVSRDRPTSANLAVDGFLDALPALTDARRQVQEARQRTDPEIIRLFRHPLRCPEGDALLASRFHATVEALGLRTRFDVRRRIVVATADTLTRRMAGPAIRAWNIAIALSMEHDVELVTTSGRCDISHPRFRTRSVDDRVLRQLERWCDVFVFQGWVMSGRPYLESSKKIIVADIYDPLHLEQLEHGREGGEVARRREVQGATGLLNDQVRRGDFFMCASEKQRDFWLGQLASLGRVNPVTYDQDKTLRSLIAIVPFGISDDPPVRSAPAMKGVVPGIGLDDRVILWGGGIYNWFDPLTLIRAIDSLRHRFPDLRLYFMGLRHPNPDVPQMQMATAAQALADKLKLTGKHVFFNEDWVAYEERQNFLLEADIGVSTHLDHIETAFSFRTRILDYLWAGLPIVATSGDALAQLVEDRSLGLAVPPGDVEALEEALARLLDDEALAKTCRENIAAVMPELVWSEALSPLVQFCRTPSRAPDLVDPDLALDLSGDAPPLGYGRGWWRRDLSIAVTHLRRGGLRLVATKAGDRLHLKLPRSRQPR